MRKKNCNKIFDNIFWYMLYLLPVVCYLSFVFSFSKDKENSSIEYANVECLTLNNLLPKEIGDELICGYVQPYFVGIDTTVGYMYIPFNGVDDRYIDTNDIFENVHTFHLIDENTYLVNGVIEFILPEGVEWNGCIDFLTAHTNDFKEIYDSQLLEKRCELTDYVTYSTKEIIAGVLEDNGVVNSFDSYLSESGLNIIGNNIVLNSFKSIFGKSGVMPIFATNTPFIFITWFINVYLIHLAVDFILAIPRLCHKWLGRAVDDE